MKRSTKSRELRMEVTVGTFMFAAFLSLAFFTIILSRENIFKTTYPLEVVFEDIMGLRDGDNVVIRGMRVGRIKRLLLQDDGVHVSVALSERVTLKQDYKIDIVATSVLGGRYMQIYAGSHKAPELAPGTEVRGITPRDLIAESTSVVSDFKTISSRIASGQGTLGKLVHDDSLYMDALDVMNEIKTAMTERHLLENLEMAAANLNEISHKINSGQGTLGKLVNDDSLYQDTRKIFSDAQSTLDDLRETAPIVTFTSIFFGAL